MEIPYTVSARRDTGLWNAKVGIWLFLASEVMLFGGLFSAYIFLRLDAGPGERPHGLLNVPVGTMNTAILIISSVTVGRAWAARVAARSTERSGRDDDHRHSHYIIGRGGAGVGGFENARPDAVQDLHAGDNFMRHHLPCRQASLRMA